MHRSLAVEPPKENAQECLRLMGIALKNLASAMNNTQAIKAAAIILGSEPIPSAIANQAPVSLNQSEIFEWLDRANVGECPPLWVIQYLLDSKYYASMRATISKFEKQWNLSVVNYQVQKSSDTNSRKV